MSLNVTGIPAALLAALLFGASTPLAKLLLLRVDAWMLAALLYLGSGLGLLVLRRLRRSPGVRLARGEARWLAGAVLSGGVVAPVLLMWGLTAMPASGASLLLNAEGVLTALLAWFVFRENLDRRVALGMLAIVAGALVLSWPSAGNVEFADLWPTLAVLGACLGWALDNNLTRKVALADASWLAMMKGLIAGATNLALGLSLGASWPGWGVVAGAALLGFVSYGASLTLFVLALRHLGTARTGACFSVAPFFGALLALVLIDEPLTGALLWGGGLMAIGVVLHLTERHEHEHSHDSMEHDHAHQHGVGDEHHAHEHDERVAPGVRHSHWHRHAGLTHTHAHFPDAHHRHGH